MKVKLGLMIWPLFYFCQPDFLRKLRFCLHFASQPRYFSF